MFSHCLSGFSQRAKRLIPLLAVVSASPVFAAGTFSNDIVQTAWFYKPPTDGTSAGQLASSYKNFVLTRGDEAKRNELKALGVKTPILQYVRFEAVQDPCNGVCPCSKQPYKNQVAWNAGDFCAIQSQHPDWFLRYSDGTVVASNEAVNGGTRYVKMDPSNAGWRAYWLSRVMDSQQTMGWDGVLADNVDASIDAYTRAGKKLQKFPTSLGFQNANSDFLTSVYGSFFRPNGVPLFINVIELPWPNGTDVWLRYVANADGTEQEDFAMGWRSGAFKSKTDWEADLARVERSESLGKRFLLISQGDQTDLARERFALASYLLVASGKSMFRYSNAAYYENHWPYANYGVVLGTPKGPRYLSGTQWKRDFANGSVSVDPTALTSTITVVPPVNPGPPPSPVPPSQTVPMPVPAVWVLGAGLLMIGLRRQGRFARTFQKNCAS